jgi:Transposase DDE domain
LTLFPTILLLCGKVNFTNLSRYSELSEKTYRRHYSQPFAFVEANRHLIDGSVPESTEVIAATDCSFIPKSGKQTYGLDWFYNGSASRTEKGLEISVISVIDVVAHQGYTLSVQQTPPIPLGEQNKGKGKGKSKGRQTCCREDIERVREHLKHLPARSPSSQSAVQAPPAELVATPEITRIDHYLKQLQDTQPHFPTRLKYLAADGFYSKFKFVSGVCALNLHMIGKLRLDANMRYLYTGPQKPQGADRKYDGKVDLTDLTRFTLVETLTPHRKLYTAVVWHVSLKRKIRLALLVNTENPRKTGFVLLFSTDLALDARKIVEYYHSRFQIEFIFRDAKQFTGLCDAQTRDPKKLDFHFNASLMALNLAKSEHQLRHPGIDPEQPRVPLSMTSYQRRAFNDHLLERFIAKLDLDPTLIKSHPNFENLRSYGIIAA